MALDLTKLLKRYKGQWIVLDKNLKNVVSADKNVENAYNEALKKGHKKPTLFKVPQKITPYFG